MSLLARTRSRVHGAALAGLLLVAVAGCDRGTYGGYPLDPALPAPTMRLPAADGGTLSLAEAGGRVTLLTFGFTSCPDICPTTLSEWRKVAEVLGPDTARVRFLFISVDWKRDTPEVAAHWVRAFHPAFEGTAIDSLTQRRVLPAFKAEARYERDAAGGVLGVAHTDYSYLVDAGGVLRTAYPFESGPALLARDLRRALRAAQPASGRRG